MSGASIRFSKLKNGTGGADAWRDSLNNFKRTADGRPRTIGVKLPKLHSIHVAHVVSMQPFGAFLQLGDGDTYKDGLLHVSCLGEMRFECPEDAGLQLGMKLWVKVSEVKEEEMKYGVDMRYVSQRDGTDLDHYQTKGRLPDNFFAGGKVKVKVEQAAPKQADARASLDIKKYEAADMSSESSEDPEKWEKVRKKLNKARKKLEKVKKKHDKVQKKIAKVKKAIEKQKASSKGGEETGKHKAGKVKPVKKSRSSSGDSA